jgi:hypothetical protein
VSSVDFIRWFSELPSNLLFRVRQLQRHRLGRWYPGLGAGAYFAALAKGNGRIKDNLIALLNAAVYFHLRAQIARHRQRAYLHLAILKHGYLESLLIKDRGISGY